MRFLAAISERIKPPAAAVDEIAKSGGVARKEPAARSRMKKIWRLWPALSGILSGILLALTMPPWGIEWLAWIAFVPILGTTWSSGGGPGRALEAPARRERERLRWLRGLIGLRHHLPPLSGFLFGVTFFLITIHWVTTVTTVGWVLLSLYLGLYPWIWTWFARRFAPSRLSAHPYLYSRHNLLSAAILSASWVGIEFARSRLLTGFGWNTAGIALQDNLPMVQIAEFTGSLGLSFPVLFSNVILLATFRRFWEEMLRGKVRAHFDFTLTMVGLVAVFLFGVHRLQNPPPEEAFQKLKVAAIQTNIPLQQHRDPRFIPQLLEIHQELTSTAAAGGPDLIVWPEASVPGGILLHWDTRDFVESCMEFGDYALMHGTLDGDPNGDYNAVALLAEKGGQWQIHHKLHLVPFGEFFPLRKFFEFAFPPLANAIGFLIPGDFTPGRRWTIFRLRNGIRIGPLICFEDTLGDLTRRFVLEGADLLVNVTNDAWFLESAASRQHLANARFRAIENRRPLVRAANTGVTAFIDIAGRVRKLESPEGSTFLRGYLSGEVAVPKPGAPLTFYSRHGEIFPMICAVISFIAASSAVVQFARRVVGPNVRAT